MKQSGPHLSANFTQFLKTNAKHPTLELLLKIYIFFFPIFFYINLGPSTSFNNPDETTMDVCDDQAGNELTISM